MKISKITSNTFNGYVYNFHCSPDKNYFANFILVHNCYKSNTPNSGYVTSFEEAKKIIDKLPKQCTQIAFGTDAKLESNHEWYEIFKYARESGFIPNVTVADITKETAKKLASVCGAVAVSHYNDNDICYNSVKYLTDEGMNQVNIHQIVSKEALSNIYKLIDDVKNDKRLEKLNAIVFLSLKKKGRGEGFNSVTNDEFKNIIDTCFKNNIRFGFDSCSAHKFMNCITGTDKENLKIFCEPCESSLMSAYINSRGEYFPCSFTEGTYGWESGLDVLNCNDFIKDIWNNPKTVKFRNTLLLNNRHCPIYTI